MTLRLRELISFLLLRQVEPVLLIVAGSLDSLIA
jgi:hypothetical protein